MKTGDILLIPFPFAELDRTKIRPVVLVTETEDQFRDLVVCAISSRVPDEINKHEILISPNELNKLRVKSVIKVDRISTLKQDDIVGRLGTISSVELEEFKLVFKSLVEN